MPGLREQKKVQRERNIVAAAERMFRERGYVSTKMEEVAEEAGVSVGTIYNYFQNKSDLLLKLVSINEESLARSYDDLLASPPMDPVEGVCQVFRLTTLQSLKGLGRENWRHLLGTSIIQRNSRLGGNYLALTTQLRDRVVAMLVALRDRDRLPADRDIDHLGDILFRIEGSLYLDLVSNDDMTFEEYATQLKADVTFILRTTLV